MTGSRNGVTVLVVDHAIGLKNATVVVDLHVAFRSGHGGIQVVIDVVGFKKQLPVAAPKQCAA